MKHSFFIGALVCLVLLCACAWSPETSFFSNFSVRQLVDRNKSSAGLNCDSRGGGYAGIRSHASGLGSRAAHFNSHRSDSYMCRFPSNETFDQTRIISVLKLDVERSLYDTGAQITERGSSGPGNFYFAYAVKNVRGRIELTGTTSGNGFYDLRA